MPRRVLDTNILINHWGDQRRGLANARVTVQQARTWAKTLVGLQQTNLILTPIYIEYVAGKGTAHEVRLARAYLDQFNLADDGRITAQDWEEAKRIVQRVLPDRSPRQLGDCLIRAICNRLHLDILTADKRFPTY
jgi:predicted nucleic acid-binding protein